MVEEGRARRGCEGARREGARREGARRGGGGKCAAFQEAQGRMIGSMMIYLSGIHGYKTRMDQKRIS